MAENLNPCWKPLVVEFAGMPGAGKTRTIDLLDHFFRREGYRVRVVSEGAQACPIGQEHRVAFAAWTAHRIANILLEETHAPRGYGLLLLDRGLFDAQAFIRLLALESKITEDEAHVMLTHFRLPFWAGLTDLVFLLDISPEESLRRHVADSLTTRPGPILNQATLGLLQSAYEDVARFCAGAEFTPTLRRLDAVRNAPRRLAELCLPVIAAALESAEAGKSGHGND